MVVLDSFPFSDVTLIQDETVNSGPRGNEYPRIESTIGSATNSAEGVAELVADTGEPVSTESPFVRCEKCHYQTKIESLLHKHIAKHSLDSDFECPTCDFRESNGYLFVDHFATHHSGASLKCPVCHRKFHKSDLKAHIMVHKAVTLYDCSMCEFSTNYIKSIKGHTEAFHGKLYKCRHCSLSLTKHELQRHIKSAHESEHSSQELVAESVESVSSLSRKNSEFSSVLSETTFSGKPGEAPFSCSHCDFFTTYIHNLKRHTEAWHTKEYQCTKCEQVMQKNGLLQHMKTVHALDDSSNNLNQNPFGRGYQSLRNTKTPSKDSSIEVPNAPLRRSLRTTKGTRSNRNQYSGKGALNTATTITLQTTDEGKKSSLVYTQSSDKHLHCCPFCDHSSKSNSDLRRHTEAWHDKKYLCKECNQMMSKHDLRLHKEFTHGLQGSSSNPSQDSGKDALMSATKNSVETSKNDPQASLTYSQSFSKHRYCCSVCDYSSKIGGNLKRHAETMHNKKYLCKECNQLMSKHDLLRHKESLHGLQGSSSNIHQDSDKGALSTENKLNTSKNDPKSSSNQNQSLDKPPHCCPLCDYSTTNKRNLNRHTQTCRERKCQCKECNQVMFKQELLLHMVVSHGLLPSGSNQNQDSSKCSPKSPTKNCLKNDSEPATNSQSSDNIPYSCPLCNFTSISQGICKRHTETWHDKEYQCEECNQVMSKHDLLLHMEASHGGISNQGLQTTENTPVTLSGAGNQLKHNQSYVKTSGSLQMPSPVSGASVEIQSLGILENIPKSLPESQDKTHSGSSQTSSLEIERFLSHEFRTKFSQEHTNAIGEPHSTGHLQRNDEVIEDSSNTSNNEPRTQQMKPNRRKCDFCSVVFDECHFIKHVRQCATRLIPGELEERNKFAENASRNETENPVAGTQRVASGFNLLRPDSLGRGKWRVVLKRLNLDSSTLKSAVTGKLRFLLRKKGLGMANGKVTKKPMLHCSECVFKTKMRKLLKKHVGKHLKDLGLKCPYCGYKEERTTTFVKHIAEHQGDKTTFKCCFCDNKPFSHRHSLGEHLWKHRPATLLDCSKCEFSTYRADVSRLHIEKFHVNKYRCRVCGATMNRFKLEKHTGKAHGATMKFDSHLSLLPVSEQRDLQNQVPDSNCKEATNMSSLFSAHHTNPDQAKDLEHQTFANIKKAKRVPGTSVLKQSVVKGSESTPESDALAENGNVEILAGEHELIRKSPCVSLKDPFQTLIQQIDSKEPFAKLVNPYLRCSKCSFKTRIKSLLKQHVAKHLIDDRFPCTKCDFKESDNWKFARHWFSHNTGSQQMIRCCFCPAQYKKNSCLKGSLPGHIEHHRVVKLFDCSMCEFSGADKYALKRHFQKHHSKQHYCKVCGKFMTLNRWSKHAYQCTRFHLEEPCVTEQVVNRPSTLEHGTKSLGANTTRETRDNLVIDESHPTPKMYAGLEFAKRPCSLLVPPEESSCTTEASSSINADITLGQTGTTTPLVMPCDMNEEYFCVACKSWISLDDFAIHQKQCRNTINTRLVTANEASTIAANMEERSVDVGLLSFSNESIKTHFEQNEANNCQTVELANVEASETALGIEPIDSEDFSNRGVAVPTNPKSRTNKDVELKTPDADAKNIESDVHITSKFNSGDATISLSSDSEDSYGSPCCDTELVGEGNSAPVLDFTNVIQDHLKNLLKLPNTDDVLPLCQSRNSKTPMSSEQSHGKYQLEHSKWMDLTHGSDHLNSVVRNMPVLQGGSQSYAKHSDMANPVEPGNESILNIPSDSAVVGLLGQPKWRNVPSVARTHSEALLSVSGAAGKASSGTAGKAFAEGSGMVPCWQNQSLSRSPRSSISPYPEIGFPPGNGSIQRFASTSKSSSQPSEDPSKDVPIWRYADGQWIISRYVRNTSNIKTPSAPSTSD